MFIKQYEVGLPADYDMRIIRERVATKGGAYDRLPGLGVKVFLIRERGRHGAQANQYAPLYLWPTVEASWGFIAGEGFKGILDSFGWTPIQYWLGFAYSVRPSLQWKTLKSVTRERCLIEPGTSLSELRTREAAAAAQATSGQNDRVARAVGVDTANWSMVRYDYWTCDQERLPSNSWSYEVLHVSAPEAAKL